MIDAAKLFAVKVDCQYVVGPYKELLEVTHLRPSGYFLVCAEIDVFTCTPIMNSGNNIREVRKCLLLSHKSWFASVVYFFAAILA